jgi:hypothetical protein
MLTNIMNICNSFTGCMAPQYPCSKLSVQQNRVHTRPFCNTFERSRTGKVSRHVSKFICLSNEPEKGNLISNQLSQDEVLIVTGATALSFVSVLGIVAVSNNGYIGDSDYYFDSGFSLGDLAGSALWALSFYFVSPLQLLLFWLGKIETERPSDWIMRVGGKIQGNDVDALGYEPSSALKAFAVSVAIFSGILTASVLEVTLGDATWSVATGIGAIFAAFIYEVGRPERLSKDDLKDLESIWQDFSAFADASLARSGRCHESEIFREFRKRFGKYRTEESISDARIRDMVKNWNPEVKRTRNGFYQNISIKNSINSI